jgi:predicted glycosyltransferase
VGDWLDVTSRAIPHEQLICAADAVLGKPGFSTVAEVLAHERRFLFVSREHFRENEVLVRGLRRQGCARELPRDDFASGRLRPHLDALFEQAPPAPAPRTDGADQIADALAL